MRYNSNATSSASNSAATEFVLICGVAKELANGLLSVTPDDVVAWAEDEDVVELPVDVVVLNVVDGLELEVWELDEVLLEVDESVVEVESAAAEDEGEEEEDEEDVEEDDDELGLPPVVPNPIWLLSKSKAV